MKKRIYYIIYLLCFVACPVEGQVNDSMERLLIDKVNNTGTAISYYLTTNNGSALNLFHISKNKSFQFVDIHLGTIMNDSLWLGWSSSKRTLYKVNLNEWKKEEITEVDSFEWFFETGNLLLFDIKKSKLTFKDFNAKNNLVFTNVTSYEISSNRKEVLMVMNNKKALLIKQVGNKIEQTWLYFDFETSRIKKVQWNRYNGKFYILVSNGTRLSFYTISKGKLVFIAEQMLVDSSNNSQVDTLFRMLEFIDKDHIIMGVKPQETVKDNVGNLWLGSSKGISTALQKNYKSNLQGLIFNLHSEKSKNLFEEGKINIFKINANSSEIYIYEKNEMEDLTKQYPSIKLYSYDLNNDEKTTIGEFNGYTSPFLNSMHDSRLFYFKAGNWYTYDSKLKKHTLITQNSAQKFYDQQNEFYDGEYYLPNQLLASYKKRYFIFESTSDIWFYDRIENRFDKKTNGDRTNRSYSLLKSPLKSNYNKLYWSVNMDIDCTNILLSWQSNDRESCGISLLQENGQIKDLMQTKGNLIDIKVSKNYIAYVKEQANKPPGLYILDLKSLAVKQLYQTNKTDTIIPKTTYLEWKNNEGESRGAVVHYPKNYDPKYQYPAVLNIYEKKYPVLHKYQHVSSLTTGNINYRQYTEDGYFVIEPDIYYQLGEVGKSALNSVTTAISKVLEQTSIDKERIGIIGHSFGGYQANFIITQTDLFKVAVSSAGVFDLETMYLTMNWDNLKPDMWRLENQQFRMGKGMYDDHDVYTRNSPSNFVRKISTPLLLITGDKDYQVNWQQSVMMFLALKRLKKEVNLIIYPNEGHVFLDAKVQADYSLKVKQWFDYYLKNEEKPRWLKEEL